MSGLLGFMAAGGAMAYADAKNAETEQRNKMALVLFDKEVDDLYQQRRDERMMKREDTVYQRSRGDKLEDEKRERGYKKEDFEMASTHDINKMKLKHGFDASIEQMRQAGANSRAEMKRKYGLLNTSSYSSKEEESDYRRLYDLQTKLHDPMTKLSPQLKEVT